MYTDRGTINRTGHKDTDGGFHVQSLALQDREILSVLRGFAPQWSQGRTHISVPMWHLDALTMMLKGQIGPHRKEGAREPLWFNTARNTVLSYFNRAARREALLRGEGRGRVLPNGDTEEGADSNAAVTD